jgi:hypothetical protein
MAKVAEMASGPRGRQMLDPVVHQMNGQANLLELVGTFDSPRGFPRTLDRRQQQRDQNPNDGDHDQQFDKRKRCTLLLVRYQQLTQCECPSLPAFDSWLTHIQLRDGPNFLEIQLINF